MSYGTVARWIRKFKGGLELIEGAPNSGHKTSTITQKKPNLKVKDLIARDARYTVRDIARIVGISV